MKAAVIHEFKGIEKIYFDEIPTPTPKPHEVQIKVHFAGINPVDWKIADGLLKSRVEYRFPIVLGWDVSGTISAIGSEVTTHKVGDPVFAFCFDGELLHLGSYAEYLCFPAKHVAHKPEALSFAEAAAIPLVSITAYQAIHDHMTLKSGDNVLIQAGAGGVGGFAIQFAKAKGAHVLTTCSPKNFEYVADLGADEIIDYTKEPFYKQIPHQSLDVVFDTIGTEAITHSLPLINPGGHLVTIAGAIDERIAAKHSVTAEWFMLSADAPLLTTIGKQLAEGKFKLPQIRTYPFDDLESALHENRERTVRGKLVLEVFPG